MKVVITSDTHFGDPTSQLAALGADGRPVLGSKYADFKNAAGKENDYLILLGDVIDVAVERYKDAFDIFIFFLNQLVKDNLAKKVLYVPGNHDFDVWHTVEYQANIINRVSSLPPRQISLLRMAVPAVIDDRPSARYELFLGGVMRGQDPDKPYGHHLFLDFLTNKKLNISVGYPNAYLVTSQGETLLLTHGQYFEDFWSLISDWAPKIFKSDYVLDTAPMIMNLTHVNYPLSQLSSSGVGQAGPLTKVLQDIQRDFKHQKIDNIRFYLDNLQKEIRTRLLKVKWYNPISWSKVWALAALKKAILKEIKKTPHLPAKEDKGWEDKAKEKMDRYYLWCQEELRALNEREGFNYPDRPGKLIFGHTHRPIGITNDKHRLLGPGLEIPVYNTGGWLQKKEEGEEGGSELFIYETGKPLRSIRIF
jgi:UDP-2,3-diacylglucosamine pyrophosphatase LpxH